MKLGKILKSTTFTLIFTGLLASSALAAGTGDDPTPTKDIPTVKQQQALSKKLKELQIHKDRAESKYQIMALGDLRTVGVTPFKQETTYWCGPATTKQVLNYLNGSSESQSYYAQKLGTTRDGTDFTVVDNVLNNLQSKYTYSYSTSLPIESWKYAIMYSSDNYHPAVLDLKITGNELENYTGTVSGHIINVSGYDFRTNDAKVRLTDPYDQGNRGKTHGNKWYSLEKVWQANQNHFRQATIW
ncbi:C39 family peptidase [Paenibacillus polymyxa]|uniref:C39 family peptidase n=1 Tax=Paenibacillus polymyxa TaxID=1406 RepID=UPI001BEA7C27|nr:C39 family peptidase [Paenibacillus polymyxa]MBT2284415.1 C39 family peptidase [Paenibacillus polymyxa]